MGGVTTEMYNLTWKFNSSRILRNHFLWTRQFKKKRFQSQMSKFVKRGYSLWNHRALQNAQKRETIDKRDESAGVPWKWNFRHFIVVTVLINFRSGAAVINFIWVKSTPWNCLIFQVTRDKISRYRFFPDKMTLWTVTHRTMENYDNLVPAWMLFKFKI